MPCAIVSIFPGLIHSIKGKYPANNPPRPVLLRVFLVFSDCEESGIVPKQYLPLARREFLKGSGILMGA
jgi:hypothetical protein